MKETRSTQLSNPQTKTACQVLTLLLLVVLVGCSSVSTRVDKAPVKGRSFSFLNTGSREIPSYAETRQQVHTMVQQALIKNLGAKGVSHVESGGEVTVAYLVIVGDNAATTSMNDYFGYSADSDALVKKVHAEDTTKDTRSYFQAGTLVVDLIDPASSKLLQRRSMQAPVLKDLTQEARTARVQTIVDEMLKDVPISP